MFGRLFGRGKKKEAEKEKQPAPGQETESSGRNEPKERELRPEELETFKRAMGITPHNYWTWATRTNNFKLITDGEYIWVEGYKEHIGKRLPMTEQRAWSWDYIRERLSTFGG
jgi:hypothetical protein